MPVINSIADLRVIARRRMPRALFDYIDRGSYDELTWTRNRDDCARCNCVSASWSMCRGCRVGTTVLGEHWNMPVALAPTGLTGLLPSRRRNPGGARRAGGRRALLPEHHVHLLDRRRARRGGRHASGSSSISCAIAASTRR